MMPQIFRAVFRIAIRYSPLIVCLVHILPLAAHAELATGVVFVDANRNGRMDSDERGLAGVAVSNGRAMVVTDGDGRYAIEMQADQILFIAKPADYAVPTDSDQLPQFFYRHYPQGTPASLALRYPGIPASGPLPPRIDFPLYHRPESRRYDVLLFADTQPQTETELDFVRDDVIQELIGIDAAFGMTVGDIAFDEMSLLPRLNALIGQIGIPWYNVPGNHELNFLAPDDERSLETFKRYYGPPYYSFDYGDVHFVILDDVLYHGTDSAEGPNKVRGQGSYEGRITEPQLKWLAQDLALVGKDRLVLVAMHIPLTSYNDPQAARAHVINRQALFKILAERQNVFSIAGHMHISEHHYFDRDQGYTGKRALHHHTLGAVSGSWWSGPDDERGIPITDQRDGTPNGYYLLSVDGTNAKLRFKAASRPADFQMRVTLDKTFHQISDSGLMHMDLDDIQGGRVASAQLPHTEVVVNLFNGGPKSSIEMRIDDGAPRRLTRVVRPDPYIHVLFAKERQLIKPWVQVEPSSHLWAAPLPADLAVGAHTLYINAEDEYGNAHFSAKIIEVGQ